MNIYLGNLNYQVKEADLEELLSPFGTVESVKLILDRDTKRSKGFAFAEMEDDAARKAIEELMGTEYKSRALVIKEALPRK